MASEKIKTCKGFYLSSSTGMVLQTFAQYSIFLGDETSTFCISAQECPVKMGLRPMRLIFPLFKHTFFVINI